MQRKDISSDLRKVIVAAHQSGKAYKTTPKVENIQTVYNLPRSRQPSKFTPRSDCVMLRETG